MNIINKKIGYLTVDHIATQEEIENYKKISKRFKGTNPGVYWFCKCDCGNYCITTTAQLNRSNRPTRSCGCFQKEKLEENGHNEKDLSNKRSGKLVFLEPTDKREDGKIVWKCKCDCGNITYKRSSFFNKVHSCGCICSKGEEECANILKEFNIKFEREHKFEDLIGEYYNLRFDFAIIIDKIVCLIEYQGVQHYDESSFFHNKKLKKYDLLKKEYCFKNNIPLYEIKYNDNIREKLLQILKKEGLL